VRQSITDRDRWNRDHHPPKRFFARSVRQPDINLTTLSTHNVCNMAFKHDEEYFVAAMPIQAMGTWTADAVLRDFGEGVRDGRWRSLYERVRAQFGRIELPGGRIAFHAEFDRLNRVAWKLARGAYYTQVGRVLPERSLRTIEIVLPQSAAEILANHEWFAYVRDTPSLSHVAAVFDLKMIRDRTDEMAIGLMSMLLWDKIVLLVAFHDLACPCVRCRDARPTGENEQRGP
jgi:hypothetical protein